MDQVEEHMGRQQWVTPELKRLSAAGSAAGGLGLGLETDTSPGPS